MTGLCVGFGRVNVTPMMGIKMRGYFSVRLAEAVLDELEINALALACGDTRVVLLSMDVCSIQREMILPIKEHVAQVNGLPPEGVYIHNTHIHTGPYVRNDTGDPLEEEYYAFVRRRMADAARFALADLQPAKMGWSVGQAPEVAFVRRYRMKDGRIENFPGFHNPDILGPVGEPDRHIQLLRFDRESGDHVLLVNYGNHPDVIGGCKISADWPGFLRRELEKTLENSHCVFFNGAEGDVNHLNFLPSPEQEARVAALGGWQSYDHARYIGKAMAEAVEKMYGDVRHEAVESLRCRQKLIRIPSNMPEPEELPEAHRVNDLYLAGRLKPGMEQTMSIAKAARIVELEHGPEYFEIELSAVALGNVGLIGIPGEPFNSVGVALKETEGYGLVLPTCLTNGNHGYFPTRDAYVGGYESDRSRFKPGVAEIIIEEGKKLLRELAE